MRFETNPALKLMPLFRAGLRDSESGSGSCPVHTLIPPHGLVALRRLPGNVEMNLPAL